MGEVAFEQTTRRYPNSDAPAVDELNLTIDDGEFLVLVGPSGCGKSTSLRMLAGLEPVDSGIVRIDQTDVTHRAPKDRDIAMVFQNYALYPHMTVAENMAFALKVARTNKAEIRERVAEAAKLLDLTEYLDRTPKALSGGQRQRVAMGRAIVRKPQVFLMDEPLSNLDAKLRVQTRTEISALQRRMATTTVYVTHDQVEAMTMGDRVAVLSDGILQQVGAPYELYDSPVNVFVAAFIGSPGMNLVEEVPLSEAGVTVGDLTLGLDSVTRTAVEAEGLTRVTVGFRAEELVVTTNPDGFEVTVEAIEELGADAFIFGQLIREGIEPTRIAVRTRGRTRIDRGSVVRVTCRPQDLHVFSPVTGLRLSDA